MITATYFGEITELDSRAVWYSDEEEDDEDEDDDGLEVKTTPKIKQIEPLDHEKIRSNIQINFTRTVPDLNLKFNSCLISLSSHSQFKNFRLSDAPPLIGCFDFYGRAFVLQTSATLDNKGENLLWLMFDASNPLISGHEVGYFVEALRKVLHVQFDPSLSNRIIILSQQFSASEDLEYLSNFKITNAMKNPFLGRPILPPALIKNQFESTLFEQLTLSLKPALVVCLPNPKNFWFDKIKNWPSIPNIIIELRLNDDNLEKTLIFT